MNQELIDMAEKAGVAFSSDEYPDIWSTYMHVGKEEIEAFAALVAAAEREACAKVCEDLFDPRWRSEHNAASQCAEAIRARGKTE
jgi:hypothetical protein